MIEMKAKLLNISELDEAANLLKQGEVVGFPTETVYGLSVIFDNEDAFNKMMIAKNRPPHKPFTLMCGDVDTIQKYALVDNKINALINKYMPGPITLILKVKEELPYWVTLGSPFVGVRIPSNEVALEIIKKVGKPLLVPSANKSGEPPLSNYQLVYNCFGEEIAAIVSEDAGGELPSTIVKIDDDITLVREGSIPFADIKKVWEEN